MMAVLDDRFAKVVALMRSTQHEGERDAARSKADQIAAQCGLSLEDALKQHDTPKAPPRPPDFFAGFDDWMEEREPGWKAQRAQEKAERQRAQFQRKMALLDRYGSREAALAPCWREELLHAAFASWRKVCRRPHQRWTQDLAGYGSSFDIRKQSPELVEAAKKAYPLPTVFAEAKGEHDYWNQRRRDVEDLLDGQFGDDGLDLTCQVRADIVRDLVDHELEVTTLADLHARFTIMVASQSHEPEMEKALYRDLTAMMQRGQVQEFSPDPGKTSHAPNRPEHDGRIKAALEADATRSDRHIAREVGCSPTTVGNVRRALGLSQTQRSVHRGGGQTYSMKPSFRRAQGGQRQ